MKRTKLLLSLAIFASTLYSLSSFAQGSWSAISGLDAPVQGMLEYQGNLYIGRLTMTGQDYKDRINKWDGSTMSNVGLGTNGAVTAFTIFNNELYVAGGFTSAGGAPAADVAKWDGTKWTAIGLQLYNFSINALAIYNGELYAGGFSFDTSLTKPAAFTIAKWNGSSWVNVGSGLQGGDVYSLAVFNNELYAAGTYPTTGGPSMPLIEKWNGTSWSKIGTGSNTGTIFALKVHNGALYAAGNFPSLGGTSTTGIAKWNGSAWSSVGGSGTDRAAFALGSDGTNLYLGGAFNMVSGVTANHIAKWDGTKWSAIGTGVGIPNDDNEQVYSIAYYKNTLYAGGIFSEVNGKPGSYLARWNNTNTVDKIAGNEIDAQIFPNPISQNSAIGIFLNHQTELSIAVYDMFGRKVADVFNGKAEEGHHKYEIGTLKDIAQGIYTVSIKTDNNISTQKLIVR